MNAESIPHIVKLGGGRRLTMPALLWIGWSLIIGVASYAGAVVAYGAFGVWASIAFLVFIVPAITLGAGFYMGAKQQ